MIILFLTWEMPMLSRAFETRALFAAGVAIALSGACSNERGVMNEDEFCVEYAKRECQKVAVACALAKPTQCEEARKGVCREWVQKTKSEARGFRPENVEPCLKKVSDTYSEPLIKAEHWKALNDVCQRVFLGNRQLLEMCASDADCAMGLICDKRRCSVRRDVGPGTLCANPGDICPKTEYCKMVDVIWQCTRKLERGRPCGAADPCADTLRCRTTCIERIPLGNACAQDDDCESGYCFPYRAVCAAGLNFALGSPSCEAYEGKLAPVTGGVGDAGVAADAE